MPCTQRHATLADISNAEVPRLSAQNRRITIGGYYIEVLGAPDPKEWSGRDGTIATIIREFKMPSGSTAIVNAILDNVLECTQMGVEYNGACSPGSGGHNKCIELNSAETQIIADAIEGGLGLQQVTPLVNEYRASVGKVHVGMSAVHSAVERLQPIVTTISAAKQGSTDANSEWAKAWLNLALQEAIQVGAIAWDILTMGPCPSHFNIISLDVFL